MKPVNSERGIIDRSYQLLALLDVCRQSASQIEAQPHEAQRAAGSLASVLRLASEIASEIHDAQSAEKRQQHRDARALI
jgi:hypothetical protein